MAMQESRRVQRLNHRALFPKGNKAVTTTAPHKKRKLSPPAAVEELVDSQDPSEIPLLVESSQPRTLSSPSIPRFIPPHLQGGSRHARSPTPEPPNTSSSSPSGPYSGLNIDSDGSGYENASGPESGSYRRRTSLAQTGLRGGAASYRAASPAKRRASAMGDNTRNQTVDDMTMTEDQERQDEAADPGQLGTTATQNAKGLRPQHKREAPVDMTDDAFRGGSLHTPQSGVSSTGLSASETPPAPEMPSIDDQISQVLSLTQNSLQEGQKGYIMSTKWLARVMSRSTDAEGSDKYGKEAREGPIGKVDNAGLELVGDSDLIDEKGEKFVALKPGLQISDDFEPLPQAAWDLITKWYGIAPNSPIITRYCHNTSTSEVQENVQYELYPPTFTILKLPDTSAGLQQKDLRERDLTPVKILASRHELYQTFLKRAKEAAGIELKSKVRIWRLLASLTGSSAGMITPAQSRSSSPAPGALITVDPGKKLVLDANTFSQLQLGSQRELIDSKDETANEKYNGHLRLDIVGLRQDEVIVLEEQIGGPAGGEWVSDSSTAKARTNGVPISVTKSGATIVQNSLKPNAANSRATSPAPGGMMTRGRQNKNGRTRGTIGLNNLGNTCYMNSALQCVRSVEELTTYFLEDKYKKELNPRNPLSHNGEVAKIYAKLLHEMYSPHCAASFAPRTFKNIIGKCEPSFSGYQQQDSQEFLLFLLDGLQEDLNRIDKKPYIEKPDSTDEMVHDRVALREMADKCWDIYKKRNDSVITDLFAGMYKSTVVCPVCEKVSIIFDPFNNLTLQLPIENVWTRTLYFFPLHSRATFVSVDVDKNSSWSVVKDFIAARFEGVDSRRLVCAEIYKQKFYKIFDDKNTVGEENLSDGDHVAVFEVEDQPTNYPPPKKATSKKFSTFSSDDTDIPDPSSPLADKMLVSVFHRRSRDTSSRYTQKAFFGMPGFIVVNRAEAHDFDAVLRKCLGKAANLTTRPFLEEEAEATDDSDTVILNADDSSDSKVQAESLESEDGMVDISMKDDSDDKPTTGAPISHGQSHAKKLPTMLQPGSFITPSVRQLFDMKYYSSNSEMVPLGFTTFGEESREFPSISSRQEQSYDTSTESDSLSTNQKLRNRVATIGESPPGSDDEIENTLSSALPALDNGSDSDGLPPIEKIIQPPAVTYGGSKNRDKPRNSKGLITYSRKDGRKGKGPAPKIRGGGGDSPEHYYSPLLRPGECIILDWTPQGYDALFSGSELEMDEDEMRGAPTWETIPTYPDPELDAKRKVRSNRKRGGFSLGDCLDEFGKSETLSENDAWYCPRCKEHRRASKTFELWKAPDILVIHLKRFSAQGRFRDKLDVLVDFPTEGLDLTSRLAQDDGKSPIYDLFAVDNHYGGLGGGHYTAFAQNFVDQTWYEYNDSSVSRKSNPQAVVTAAAYLLFYRRRAPSVLGGPFFEQLVSNINDVPSESQPTSRAASPSGEGKRLDDSSRNGSSSALRGVGAAHQAGGGGLADGRMRTGVDDELPAYESIDPRRLQADTLEGMELDDEGIGMEPSVENGPWPQNHYDQPQVQYIHPQWSFNVIGHDEINAPPGSKGSSVKAGGSISDSSDRMADFEEDEAVGTFGTPPTEAIAMEPPPVEDEPVYEVRVAQEDDDEVKMD